MSVKSVTANAACGALSAISFIATAAHDGPRKERIEEIDKTIKHLQEERALLVSQLIDTNDI